MAKVMDVSNKLGEYMLRGWVLTDSPCSTRGCPVPLLRSPNGHDPVVHFCANCDGDPNRPANPATSPDVPSEDTPILSRRTTHTTLSSDSSVPSPSLSAQHSRSSTPATEFSSSALSSPTFAPPAETEESIRRRQQSDLASAEIGKRLLKGWAMLADECPNSRCYGVPLVRPPKTGGTKDQRKECVVCGTTYVNEKDASGWERLVPFNEGAGPSQSSQSTQVPNPASSSREAKGKEPVKGSVKQGHHDAGAVPLTSDIVKMWTGSSKTDAGAKGPVHETASSPAVTKNAKSALSSAAESLEQSLTSLAERLNVLSGGHLILDPTSIGQTAEAMGKVTTALSEVKKLQLELGAS